MMNSQEILAKLSKQHGKVLDAITGGLRDVRAAEQAILRACDMAGRLHYELENQTAETMKTLGAEPPQAHEVMNEAHVDRRLDGVQKDFERLEGRIQEFSGRLSALESQPATEDPSAPLPEGQVPMDAAEFRTGKQVWRRSDWMFLDCLHRRPPAGPMRMRRQTSSGPLTSEIWQPQPEDIISGNWEAWPEPYEPWS